MSNAGLGAFVQGLTQGYMMGDKLQTNAQEREVRGLQMGKLKRDIARDSEIDGARTNVIAASKELIANPDDEGIRSRHRQALIDYTAVATPEKLPDVQKTFKNEDIENTSRAAAGVIRGLLSGDQSAIPAAAKLNGFLPNGVEIDTNNSAISQDGTVKFALVKTGTGEPAGERMFNKEQLVTLGLGTMSNPDKFFELTAKMFEGKADRDVKLYGINTESKSSAARTGAIIQGNQIHAGLREDKLKADALEADRRELARFFQPRIKAIQDNIDSKYDPKKQAELLATEENRAAYADDVISLNHRLGISVPVRRLLRDADDLSKGVGITGPWKDPNSGYGVTREGYVVPMPPGKGFTPSRQGK